MVVNFGIVPWSSDGKWHATTTSIPEAISGLGDTPEKAKEDMKRLLRGKYPDEREFYLQENFRIDPGNTSP